VAWFLDDIKIIHAVLNGFIELQSETRLEGSRKLSRVAKPTLFRVR